MDDSKQILEIEKFVGKTILCGTFLGQKLLVHLNIYSINILFKGD